MWKYKNTVVWFVVLSLSFIFSNVPIYVSLLLSAAIIFCWFGEVRRNEQIAKAHNRYLATTDGLLYSFKKCEASIENIEQAITAYKQYLTKAN
jgi:hypothetical protein